MAKMKLVPSLPSDVSAQGRWIVLIMLFCVVVAMGGGSRSDISSMPYLRAVAVFVAFFAVATMPTGAWRPIRIPLLIFGSLATWMLIQQIPLPSGIWSALPGRDVIYAMDELLAHENRWRPISLTPSLTLNSLLSLTVPIAALLAAASVAAEYRDRLWWLLWAFALASSVFALLQFVAGPRSAFYLYRITNDGSLVGLFANRNHHAFLLSLGTLAAGWLIVKEMSLKSRRAIVIPACGASIIMFFVLILVTGSRLGLICGVLALAVTYAAIRWGYRFRYQPVNRVPSVQSARSATIVRTVLNVVPIVVAVGIGALVYLSGRASSVTRLMGGVGDGASEMRVAALNTVTGLLNSQWLFGSGFGSFAKVYQMVEPDELLRPSYFNHAHNDWLQFPIEGGAPAVLIVTVLIGWIVVSLFSLWRRAMASGGPAPIEVAILGVCFGFLAIGSLVDYPLRQPSIMMLTAFLVTILVSGGSDRYRARKKH